ncbi:hypothetical protein [Luteolibacter marinus]|uniref:hypothetical protein n=1 Tax=Luteolibacter marinus TaxID=2776705 RepID=UPI00186706D9|nr:hypothetical protein [Luteolibacter marinus]
MNPEALFRTACDREKPAEFIGRLTHSELRALVVWLREGSGRGVRGFILGLAELEAAERFLKDHTPTA